VGSPLSPHSPVPRAARPLAVALFRAVVAERGPRRFFSRLAEPRDRQTSAPGATAPRPSSRRCFPPPLVDGARSWPPALTGRPPLRSQSPSNVIRQGVRVPAIERSGLRTTTGTFSSLAPVVPPRLVYKVMLTPAASSPPLLRRRPGPTPLPGRSRPLPVSNFSRFPANQHLSRSGELGRTPTRMISAHRRDQTTLAANKSTGCAPGGSVCPELYEPGRPGGDKPCCRKSSANGPPERPQPPLPG